MGEIARMTFDTLVSLALRECTPPISHRCSLISAFRRFARVVASSTRFRGEGQS
jgi:hypothetical protein